MCIRDRFNIGAIISVLVIFLVSATETIGDTSALASSGLNREVSKKELTGSIAADGFVSALSGLFGCLPITSFSQNVGLVSMTKVVNRFTIFTGCVIMVLAGLFPMFGTLLADVYKRQVSGTFRILCLTQIILYLVWVTFILAHRLRHRLTHVTEW